MLESYVVTYRVSNRINGLLTWIGRGFGIHHLTLQLVIRYIFYPVTFFLGKIEDPCLSSSVQAQSCFP